MDHSDSLRLSLPGTSSFPSGLRTGVDHRIDTDRPAAPGRPLRGSDAGTPPLNRGSMVPRPWLGWAEGMRRMIAGGGDPAADFAEAQSPQAAWQLAAKRRRGVLISLIATMAAVAATWLASVHWDAAHPLLSMAQVLLFSLLFAWISAGFFTAMMGFVVQLRGDRHALSVASAGTRPLRADARTAIIMPICNEQVGTVFAGLRATAESLAATGMSRLFDIYVLSDTADPALRAAELSAWAELRETMGDGARVYYRWRQRRTRRKAGNVADFCRRFGRDYRYMVVLDADSVMSGDCLVSMVRLMEAHPKAGIIQTAPQAFGLQTLHARAQQFAGRVMGRLFTVGMQYWQLGESHYWGHNAIIRVEPFMKHCALAPLPGRGGLSGDILSHDFVEAALMRRGGYQTWLVPDLQGSHEQQPANLLEELQRDRRWCQGNLQNARLIAEPGLQPVHRAMLVTGAMSYLSAPLWLCYLILGATLWLPQGMADTASAGLPTAMVGLWVTTAVMLFLPRILAVASIVMRREQRQYGGTAALIKGSLLEAGLSVLQAPVRMVAHSMFVLAALTGLKLSWKSPAREASAIAWRDAAARFGAVSAVALALLGAALVSNGPAAIWVALICVPLLLAIPLTVLTSSPDIGRRVQAGGWLTTPEETWTPKVLRHAAAYARRARPERNWAESVADTRLFHAVCKAMGPRNTMQGVRGAERRAMVDGLLAADGAQGATPAQRQRLLSEPQALARLLDGHESAPVARSA